MENPQETPSINQPAETIPEKTGTLSKSSLVIGAVVILVLAGGVWYFMKSNDDSTMNQSNKTQDTMGNISYLGRQYSKAYTFPESVQPNQKSESYEWTTGGETVENWTSLITTHKITSTKAGADISAEGYAQNVVAMQEENGAFILETSVINQDTAELAIDPKNPPYFLSYLFAGEGMTEFNLQKIQMLPDGSVVSIIYAERFATKNEADMKAYYESTEQSQKRIDLIKLAFPY